MPSPILVIRLGALGDIFLAMDVFHALRVHHANDRLIFLTRPQFAELARKMPWFDEVWTDSGPKFWQVGRWLALRRQLRGGHFARVYDLQSNDRTAAYFRLLGSPKPEWAGTVPGCAHRVPPFKGLGIHATQWFFQIVGGTGVRPAGHADLSWLNGSLDDFRLPEKIVVLVPGCAAHRPGKRWPAAHYAKLADRLAADGFAVVMTGTAADRETIQGVARLAPHVIDLAGKTDIGQLAALARRAMGVVGNDTGPVHIMATAGAPTLVLMSAESSPTAMLPGGPKVGCLQRDSLADLRVEEVWQKLAADWPAFAAKSLV